MISPRRLFFFLLFILSSLSVLAGDYPNTGGEDGSHTVFGIGYFNGLNALNIEVTGVRTISSPSLHPLVTDLDGDGTKEIIVFNSNTVELYRAPDLSVIESFAMPGVGTSYIRAHVYDIDGDGMQEIIARAYNDPTIAIVEYNGTHIYLDSTFEFFSNTNDCIFKCYDVGACFAACNSRLVPSSTGYQNMRYGSFNINGTLETSTQNSLSYGAVWACPIHPSVPSFYVGNTDNDAQIEIVVSYAIFVETASDYIDLVVEIQEVASNGSFYLQSQEVTRVTGHQYNDGVTDACLLKGGDGYLTAPGVGNLDGALGDGLEIVVGMMDSTETFEINQYSGIDLNLQETYNDLTVSAEGELVSNVIFMDAFPGSESQDFCVVGYEKTEREITALCGTNSPDFGYSDEQSFDMRLTDYMNWNITRFENSFSRLSTGAEMLSTEEDGDNLDEIVTSYGIFSLNYDTLSGEDLEIVYNSPIGRDAIIIPADGQSSGLNDLIIQTASNLYYVDDGYTNTPAYIDRDYSTIDPCTAEIWKLNTSVLVSVRAADVDPGDRVQARAILYYGTTNEQDTGWSDPTTAPTDYGFVFEANDSIIGGILYVMVRDPDKNNRTFPSDLCLDPSSDDGCKKRIFSVSAAGTGEYGGDCVESFGSDPDDIDGGEAGDECAIDSDCNEDYYCSTAGVCTSAEPTPAQKQTVRDSIAPPGIISPAFRAVWGFFLVALACVGGMYLVREFGIKDSHVSISIIGGSGLLVFLFLIFFDILPSWPLWVMIVLAAGVIAFRITPLGRSGG